MLTPSQSLFKSRTAQGVAGAAVVLVALAALYAWKKRAGEPTLPARRGPLVEAVYGVGTVTARRVYQIKTSVPGIVRKQPVKEGQNVNAGDLLLTVDEGAKFTAPFAGTITSTAAKEGELINPQMPILTLMNLNDLYLEVSLEQQSALRIRKGQRAVSTFESLRNERFTGRVDAVFPREGQFIVRIELEQFPPGVLPGMTSDVAIEVANRQDVLMVPISSVKSGAVQVMRGRRRVRVPVKVGAVDAQWAEVLEGNLQAGEAVITGNP
jgi:macrolide-specific efflux system membrane fusion protein